MSIPALKTAQAGGELARERLAAYQRYAELVEAQEVALEAGDMEAFERLSKAALELQAGLDTPTRLRYSDEVDGVSESYTEQVVSLLRRTLARGERIQARLDALRKDTAEDIRRTSESRPQVRTYMKGSSPEERRNLDVRM